MLEHKRTALVIGATGGIGRAVAEALVAHGWNVRALHRDPDRARAALPDLSVTWVRGDAMHEADLVAAAENVSILFHGANPPGYRRWRELAIPMLANAIAAAKASGARLIFPGNVYNFGPDAGAVVDESSPQNPTTRKGAVRVEMERMLSAAAAEDVRSVVVRAGDFLGNASGSWFRAVMVKPDKPLRSVTYPGIRDVGHAWAYLPDLAETVVRLAEIEQELDTCEVFHFGGHWIEPGVEICHAVRRAAGKPDLPIRSSPGSRSIWPVPSLPSCESCWRCATSGACRSGSTIASSYRALARSPIPRSTKRWRGHSRALARCRTDKRLQLDPSQQLGIDRHAERPRPTRDLALRRA